MTSAASSTTPTGRLAKWMTALGLAYPVAAHLAVLSADSNLIAASVGLLLLLILLPALLARRPSALAILLIAGLALYQVAARGQALLLLFLPPILISGFMAWLFGQTLVQGRRPLIESIIRALHGEPDDLDVAIVDYARRLTLVWAALFAALATVNFLLATLAAPGGFLLTAGIDPPLVVPLSAWSLFANVLNYVIVGGMFAIEFQYRRRRFPQQSYRGFLDFLRKLSCVSAVFRPGSIRQP